MDPLTRYGPDPDGNMHPCLGGEYVLAAEVEEKLRRCPVCESWINARWKPFLGAPAGFCGYCLLPKAQS